MKLSSNNNNSNNNKIDESTRELITSFLERNDSILERRQALTSLLSCLSADAT